MLALNCHPERQELNAKTKIRDEGSPFSNLLQIQTRARIIRLALWESSCVAGERDLSVTYGRSRCGSCLPCGLFFVLISRSAVNQRYISALGNIPQAVCTLGGKQHSVVFLHPQAASLSLLKGEAILRRFATSLHVIVLELMCLPLGMTRISTRLRVASNSQGYVRKYIPLFYGGYLIYIKEEKINHTIEISDPMVSSWLV